MKVRLLAAGWLMLACGVVALLGCNKSAEEKSTPQKPPESSRSQELSRSAPLEEPRAWEPYHTPSSQFPTAEEYQRRAARRSHRFSQRLKVQQPLDTLRVNQTVLVTVKVKNIGPEPWPTNNAPSGTRPVNLSYHWIAADALPRGQADAEPAEGEQSRREQRRRVPFKTDMLRRSGRVVVLEGIRTPLPREIAPGEEIILNATVQAPPQAGSFVLRLTMVREGEEWFENRGGRPLDLPVTVTAQ
jgi:hypothetical protein